MRLINYMSFIIGVILFSTIEHEPINIDLIIIFGIGLVLYELNRIKKGG